MGERKVLNKYIPADFDPSLVPRGKKLSSKDGTVPVRMMLPFSLQCNTCHEFLYRGRKFNSKKEPMGGPNGTYLGITRFRFYIKCTQCARPITFLTDPQHADYEMESGGTRNYEMHKDKQETEQQAEQEAEEAKKLDPIAALETTMLESQREMADQDNLEEIKAMNARHLQLSKNANGEVDYDADTRAILKARDEREAKEQQQAEGKDDDLLTEHDEALVQSIQFGRPSNAVRRLDTTDEERLDKERKERQAKLLQVQQEAVNKVNNKKKTALPILISKRKRVVQGTESLQAKKAKEAPPSEVNPSSESNTAGGLAGLLGGYGSDSSSE